MESRRALVHVEGELRELAAGDALSLAALDFVTQADLPAVAGRLCLALDGRSLLLGQGVGEVTALLRAVDVGVVVRSQIDHDLGIDLLA